MRTLHRRTFLLLGLVAVALALSTTSSRGASPQTATLTILHTNDLHQTLDPLPRLSGYVKAFRAKHPATLFLDAGDFYGRGSALSFATMGEAPYGSMGRMGYDAICPGNHDWEYGGPRLLELMEKYPRPVVCANFVAGTQSLPANVVRTRVVELSGVRVGLLGLTVHGQVRDRVAVKSVEVQAAAREAIAELKKQGAEVIVAITHLGMHDHTGYFGDPKLARAFPEIDVIVGGHSHDLMTDELIGAGKREEEKRIDPRKLYKETGVIVVQAGGYGQYLGKLTLTVDLKTRKITEFQSQVLKLQSDWPVDKEVAAFQETLRKQHMPDSERVVAEVATPMESYDTGFWYARFVREQVKTDLVLLARAGVFKIGQAQPKMPFKYLAVYLRDMVIFKGTIKGQALIDFAAGRKTGKRLNPLVPNWTQQVLYYAGMTATYDAATHTVRTDLVPDRQYRIAIAWPKVSPYPVKFQDVVKYLSPSPPLDQAAAEGLLLDLPVEGLSVHPKTTWQLILEASKATPLVLTRQFSAQPSDWKPWLASTQKRPGR